MIYFFSRHIIQTGGPSSSLSDLVTPTTNWSLDSNNLVTYMVVAPPGHNSHRRVCARIVTSGAGEKRAWLRASGEACPEGKQDEEEEEEGLMWDLELSRQSELDDCFAKLFYFSHIYKKGLFYPYS